MYHLTSVTPGLNWPMSCRVAENTATWMQDRVALIPIKQSRWCWWYKRGGYETTIPLCRLVTNPTKSQSACRLPPHCVGYHCKLDQPSWLNRKALPGANVDSAFFSLGCSQTHWAHPLNTNVSGIPKPLGGCFDPHLCQPLPALQTRDSSLTPTVFPISWKALRVVASQRRVGAPLKHKVCDPHDMRGQLLLLCLPTALISKAAFYLPTAGLLPSNLGPSCVVTAGEFVLIEFHLGDPQKKRWPCMGQNPPTTGELYEDTHSVGSVYNKIENPHSTQQHVVDEFHL